MRIPQKFRARTALASRKFLCFRYLGHWNLGFGAWDLEVEFSEWITDPSLNSLLEDPERKIEAQADALEAVVAVEGIWGRCKHVCIYEIIGIGDKGLKKFGF